MITMPGIELDIEGGMEHSGWIFPLVLVVLLYALSRLLWAEWVEREKPWVKGIALVVDAEMIRHTGGDTGGFRYRLTVVVHTLDGRQVETIAREELSDREADSWVGTQRDVWYQEDDPARARLLPPVGEGWWRTSGWRYLLCVPFIVIFSVVTWTTFVR
ncbi:DUF3592 domain-containing protein [Luteipulveratus halotolerans]|uniref:DUF3592 domain-containing protein n=1 Tax=Luteipulveratus halotolerans TaxID=1631356 RepID=UPI0012FA0F94|nr:hypothetical protein [Luteipulveratus halotolerans]